MNRSYNPRAAQQAAARGLLILFSLGYKPVEPSSEFCEATQAALSPNKEPQDKDQAAYNLGHSLNPVT